MHRLVAVLMTTAFLVLVPQGAQAVGSCQGQDATIQAAGGTVTGTEGADVILVTGSANVFALGGDDIICVAGGRLEAGPGNDHVRVDIPTIQSANLGPGDDTYTGVWSINYVDSQPNDDPSGADQISTGAWPDFVGSGTANEPNGDVVELGGGGGTVILQAPAGSHAVISAVADSDLNPTGLLLAPADAATYVLDARPGFQSLTRDGASVASVSGFPVFRVRSPQASFGLLGTDAEEEVTVEAALNFEADLGAGADRLYLYQQDFARGGDISGGRGHDVLWALASEAVTADLGAGQMSTDSAGPPAAWQVGHFEELFFLGDRVDVTGRGRDEVLVGVGCRVNLRGGRGDDHLVLADHVHVFPYPEDRCEPSHARFRGGAGNDVMKGLDWHDVLIGGAGRDVAKGRGGRDVCRAEREKGCER